MRLDDRPADGQPHTEARRLRADEVFEDSLELRVVEADATVAHEDENPPRGGLTGRERKQKLRELEQQLEEITKAAQARRLKLSPDFIQRRSQLRRMLDLERQIAQQQSQQSDGTISTLPTDIRDEVAQFVERAIDLSFLRGTMLRATMRAEREVPGMARHRLAHHVAAPVLSVYESRARTRFARESGSVVHVLSPMLSTPLVTAAASLQRGGTSLVVVDTIGDALTADDDANRLALPNLAMRMQKVERDDRLRRLAALGAPVVAWHGPGTLDTVLQQLARRAQVPRVRA